MKRQKGAALLTALVLLMLITSIIATIAVVTHYDIRRHRMIRHAETAQGLMDGAMKLALETISNDLLMMGIDSHNDLWMNSVTYPVDGGYVSGVVHPLSSRFNLYVFKLTSTETHKEYIKLFERLCRYHGITDKDLNKVISAYTFGEIPITNPMDYLVNLDIKQETLDVLEKHVYYYPVLDGFNVNLLDEDMWQVLAGIDIKHARKLVNQLKKEPVKNAYEFVKTALPENNLVNKFTLTGETRLFEIITEAKIGEMTRASAIQVFREGGGRIRILNKHTIE